MFFPSLISGLKLIVSVKLWNTV